ncbi:MAG: FAD-binding oxidoreductase [Solirubrobacterales bacterium]|nr:FAD-binding oxidoreductase [Solirubrobacterales bacterium]
MALAALSKIAPAEPQPAPDRAPDWVAGGTPEPLRGWLLEALGEDRVLTRALDLIKYASDASPYRLIPKAVAMPRDVDDIVRLMAFARSRRVPLVFRAGGTSLNGQAQTDSVLVDARRHWQRVRVEDRGKRARVQPGTVLGQVNRVLARHGRKLGPDPASSDIACVGGVIANNSGGMRCGTVADSYRTVRSLKMVLANGAAIDTADRDAEERFAAMAPELATGLIELRDQLRADAPLAKLVARKFEIKNTTGYRLCALLDADTPLEIFRRLVIGSEGTLAFVAEAVFETLPHGRHTSMGLILFDDVEAAADAVVPMVSAGATATELMFASTLIAAANHMPGTPERWKELPPDAAALLVEFRSSDPEQLDEPERRALELLEGRALLDPPRFSRDQHEGEMLWHVREGMHGLVAAVREPGVQVIVEDVCVPPARIAEATVDVRALLGKHGFLPGVAGHASAGNLHFILTPKFGEQADLDRYERFVGELVDLIVDKYEGSLKAEHGTGLNMAPFVEREWGTKATEMMWQIKRLADPDGILGPGVVLNRDPQVHLQNLKSTPEIEEVATKCVECGFCEPGCPSRNVTTTPRQRIVIRREMARQPASSAVLATLLEQYQYEGIETCAVDGMCSHACPVGIDTGALIKGFRQREHSGTAERRALRAAQRYGVLESAARAAISAGGLGARALGDRGVAAITALLRRALDPELVPAWTEATPQPAPSRLPLTAREGACAVYLPACINRILGNPRGDAPHPTVPEALVAVSARAGLPLWIPSDAAGHCCGTPWSSKGYEQGHDYMARKTAAALHRWSGGGRLPLVIDASSCAHGLLSEVDLDGISVLDSIDWVHDHVLARLQIGKRLGRVVLHANCSSQHLGSASKLRAITARLADEVVVPAASGCCGMAGDRGWLHPELPASALRDVARELDGVQFDAYLSSNRTCEIALREVTGKPYASFVLALEELTRGASKAA